MAEASRSLGRGDWILIGWGDATFFVDQSPMETRLLDGLRAFFWPGNASVVMLDPEPGDPTRRFAAGSAALAASVARRPDRNAGPGGGAR